MEYRKECDQFINTIQNNYDTIPQYLTDIISLDNVKAWNSSKIVIISAQCGKGKSYLIKNYLYQVAKEQNKKILMLLHRKKCIEQFQKEIELDGKTDFIDIKSYQYIEWHILHNSPIDLSEYGYIVNDEFHYWLEDAGFNKTTDISFHAVMKQSNAVRIFTSATGEHVEDFIRKTYNIDPLEYKIDHHYNFVRHLTVINKDETIENLIESNIHNNKKTVVFNQSATKAYNLYNIFHENALFCCSDQCRFHQHIDKQAINSMLVNQKFEKTVLITTSCLDAGWNLVDENVHDIIIDITDISSLIQCIGRKRIKSDSDYIDVYIKNITNKKLNGLKANILSQLKMADYLKVHSTQELIHEFPRQYDKSYIIYDDANNEKKINALMYYKKQLDIKAIDYMLNLDKFGYAKYLSQFFGKQISLMCEDSSIERYLVEHTDIPMKQVKDRKAFLEKMNVRQDGHLVKGKDTINDVLINELQLPYRIREYKGSEMINGKQKRYKAIWKIEKTELL